MSTVVLISGNGSNLQALIDAGIPISAVISNRADAYGLTRAKQAGIPALSLDHREFPTRDAFDIQLKKLTEEYQPKLVILAGFMRILSDNFVNFFSGKLINIHPSLLPKYKGLDTHRRALEAGDTHHGISVHFVNSELDGGPVISQAQLEICSDDTTESLKMKTSQLEHKLYPQTIQLILDGQVQLNEDRVIFDGKPLAKSGIMLNL